MCGLCGIESKRLRSTHIALPTNQPHQPTTHTYHNAAEEEDYFDPDASGAHGQSQQAAAAAAMGAMSVLLPPLDVGRHGLEDVHFAVKGILNAKTGACVMRDTVLCGALG